MPLFKSKKAETRPQLTREQALACIPRKTHLVREERMDDDTLRLSYPLAWKPWFGALAGRFGAWDSKPRTKRLELDLMGTAAWRLIDNKRSVREIIARFAEQFGLQPREAEMSMTAFLKQLGKRGLIVIQQGQEHAEAPRRTNKGKRKKDKYGQ
jgi:hypothetical protein